VSLSIDNNFYANAGARANLYQGTAAIASWLSGLSASANAGTPAASAAALVPQVAPSYGSNSYSQFRSQVSAAATAQPDASGTAPQSGGQNPSDYQQAVAAYTDS
jgi:hypothetical protein